jgi:hypothetical protein
MALAKGSAPRIKQPASTTRKMVNRGHQPTNSRSLYPLLTALPRRTTQYNNDNAAAKPRIKPAARMILPRGLITLRLSMLGPKSPAARAFPGDSPIPCSHDARIQGHHQHVNFDRWGASRQYHQCLAAQIRIRNSNAPNGPAPRVLSLSPWILNLLRISDFGFGLTASPPLPTCNLIPANLSPKLSPP